MGGLMELSGAAARTGRLSKGIEEYIERKLL